MTTMMQKDREAWTSDRFPGTSIWTLGKLIIRTKPWWDGNTTAIEGSAARRGEHENSNKIAIGKTNVPDAASKEMQASETQASLSVQDESSCALLDRWDGKDRTAHARGYFLSSDRNLIRKLMIFCEM